jgi:hypothetical protein
MGDRGLIAGGIVVFVLTASLPFWLNAARHASAAPPALERPTDEARCVAPVEYMKTSHMALLGEWRDLAVRQRRRTWTASDGRVFIVSLTGTCLRCHANKAAFCDRCHTYVGAAPGCWDCHVAPPPPEAARRPEADERADVRREPGDEPAAGHPDI